LGKEQKQSIEEPGSKKNINRVSMAAAAKNGVIKASVAGRVKAEFDSADWSGKTGITDRRGDRGAEGEVISSSRLSVEVETDGHHHGHESPNQ
jgi:hypothetical protein